VAAVIVRTSLPDCVKQTGRLIQKKCLAGFVKKQLQITMVILALELGGTNPQPLYLTTTAFLLQRKEPRLIIKAVRLAANFTGKNHLWQTEVSTIDAARFY
jgi:hypothetical protein